MAYDENLEREFNEIMQAAVTSPSEQSDLAENILRDSVATAATRVVQALDSPRGAERLTAARIILDRVLPQKGMTPTNDPLKAFMDQAAEVSNKK